MALEGSLARAEWCSVMVRCNMNNLSAQSYDVIAVTKE